MLILNEAQPEYKKINIQKLKGVRDVVNWNLNSHTFCILLTVGYNMFKMKINSMQPTIQSMSVLQESLNV